MKTVLLSLISLILICPQILSAQKKSKPTLVIFDTDMGNDIDDVMALDMLYKYADQGAVKILGIMNNKGSAYSTQMIDILSTWYGYGKVPIGRIEDAVKINDYVDYSENVVKMNKDKNIFKYSVANHDNLLEAHNLYRKLLAEQKDHSVVVISVGFSTNLARLLKTDADQYSPLTGKELVAKKVKLLSIMAGSFGAKKRAEFNVIHDIPAAQYVFGQWPSPIVLSPFEVGAQVKYPSTSIEHDFGWVTYHPLVEAYKRYRTFPYDRPTWDLTSVYYVGDKQPSLLTTSEGGTLHVDDKGFMFFDETSAGKHRVLSIAEDDIPKLKNYFIDLIKQKPKVYR